MLFNYINTLCKHIPVERTLEMMALWLSDPLGLLLRYSNKTKNWNQGPSATTSPSFISVHLYGSFQNGSAEGLNMCHCPAFCQGAMFPWNTKCAFSNAATMLPPPPSSTKPQSSWTVALVPSEGPPRSQTQTMYNPIVESLQCGFRQTQA